ncbi:hypothetical protein [Streptomyces niveus]|uniref:hypothetical protein n=1 Tax=Streptomyces niveus TaxID=193462 RepID=UPI003675BB71
MNASVLMRLLDSGRLTVTSGLRAIERTGGRGFRVRDDDGVRTASLVVNAVNAPPRGIPDGARQLVASLVDSGLATLHPYGGVITTDPRVRVVGDLAGRRLVHHVEHRRGRCPGVPYGAGLRLCPRSPIA